MEVRKFKDWDQNSTRNAWPTRFSRLNPGRKYSVVRTCHRGKIQSPGCGGCFSLLLKASPTVAAFLHPPEATKAFALVLFCILKMYIP